MGSMELLPNAVCLCLLFTAPSLMPSFCGSLLLPCLHPAIQICRCPGITEPTGKMDVIAAQRGWHACARGEEGLGTRPGLLGATCPRQDPRTSLVGVCWGCKVLE